MVSQEVVHLVCGNFFGLTAIKGFLSIGLHKFHPFGRRGLLVALVSSELAGIAEARRARELRSLEKRAGRCRR